MMAEALATILHGAEVILATLCTLTLVLLKLWALWLIGAPLLVIMDRAIRHAILRGWVGDAAPRIGWSIKGDQEASRGASPAQPVTSGHGLQEQQSGPGHVLILGDGPSADAVLARWVDTWDGAIIAFGRFGLADRLPLKDAVRFCPGQVDGVCLNPMLMIRPGTHAWRDARILAGGLVGTSGMAADVCAAFLLDQLFTAPLEDRTLGALRRRLLVPAARGLSGRVHIQCGNKASAHPEIARIAGWMAAYPDEARRAFATINDALRSWSDGRLEEATSRLDMRLADPALGNIEILVLEAPPGDEAICTSLFAALAGQVIQQMTDAGATDIWGRTKCRNILLVIDDDSLFPIIPLLDRRSRDAQACGLTILIKSRTLSPSSMGDSAAQAKAPYIWDAFSTIEAAGPQAEHTGRAFAELGGTALMPQMRFPRRDFGWRGWASYLLPLLVWRRDAKLKSESVQGLRPNQVLRCWADAEPILLDAPLVEQRAPTTWRKAPLPECRHPWTEAPVEQPIPIPVPIPAPAPSAAQSLRQPSPVQNQLPMPEAPRRTKVDILKPRRRRKNT